MVLPLKLLPEDEIAKYLKLIVRVAHSSNCQKPKELEDCRSAEGLMAALPAKTEDSVEAFLSLDRVDLLLFYSFDFYKFFKKVDCLSNHVNYVRILFQFFEGMRDNHQENVQVSHHSHYLHKRWESLFADRPAKTFWIYFHLKARSIFTLDITINR